MKDEPCPTCHNPIGSSLKALRDERDRLMPFVTQHRPKRDEFLRWERDIKNRAERLAASEEEYKSREQQLALNEAALNELLKEAMQPKEELGQLRRENQDLIDQIGTATAEHQSTIKKLNDLLESQRVKAAAEKTKRRSAEQDASQFRGKLVDLTDTYNQLVEDHVLTKISKDRLSNLLVTANNDIAALKREKLDLAAQKMASELEAGSLRRTNEQLSRTNLQINNRIAEIQATSAMRKPNNTGVSLSCGLLDLNLVQAFSQEVSEQFTPPSVVVSLGFGPFPEQGFDDYLKSLGITPYTDSCSWIIVGREGWTEEQLHELIDDADLDEVRVFSQELFMAGILTTHDPFSLPLEILMKFADGHPALDYLINVGFEWPELVVEEDFGEPVYLRGSYERVEQSPLYRMGYQVGEKNGLSILRRRSLLKSAYHGDIPEVEDADYMEEWALPRQSRRLWRIAHHIAWLIRSRKSNYSMRYAVKDWKDDLDWMEEQFYTNRMRFKWPRA